MSLRIKEVIKEKGLSIQEVADKMGISRVGLSQHINGNPSIEVLERISKAVDVPIWQFFTSKEEILEHEKDSITCPKCGSIFVLKKQYG